MAGSSPCASCKLLRRRCAKDCVFAPYFPADDPHKFSIVHKVFGASNVSKLLQELPVHERADAVSSLVYEANARVRDPVYGCVGAISYLQNQVSQLQMQLAVAQAEILCIRMQQETMVHTEQPPVQEFPGDYDGDDCKSFLLHSTSSLSHHHHHHHPFLGFSSSPNHLSIQDCIKERQSIFGHDHDIVS